MSKSTVSLSKEEKERLNKNKANKVRDKSKDYVDNKAFLEAIKIYQKECRKAKREKREKPRLTPYLGECIWKMANKMTNHRLFYRLSYRDEMASDAIENCIQYFDNFDSRKYSNPFGYFTQIIAHAFIRRINKEERQQYTKCKMFINSDMYAEFREEAGALQSKEVYDNIGTFMENFEAKESEKKEKQLAAAKKKGK